MHAFCQFHMVIDWFLLFTLPVYDRIQFLHCFKTGSTSFKRVNTFLLFFQATCTAKAASTSATSAPDVASACKLFQFLFIQYQSVVVVLRIAKGVGDVSRVHCSPSPQHRHQLKIIQDDRI